MACSMRWACIIRTVANEASGSTLRSKLLRTLIFAYSESKLTFHFVVLVVLVLVVVLVLLRRKVEKDGNAKKGPFY